MKILASRFDPISFNELLAAFITARIVEAPADLRSEFEATDRTAERWQMLDWKTRRCAYDAILRRSLPADRSPEVAALG